MYSLAGPLPKASLFFIPEFEFFNAFIGRHLKSAQWE
jgi:hypothetical protein